MRLCPIRFTDTYMLSKNQILWFVDVFLFKPHLSPCPYYLQYGAGVPKKAVVFYRVFPLQKCIIGGRDLCVFRTGDRICVFHLSVDFCTWSLAAHPAVIIKNPQKLGQSLTISQFFFMVNSEQCPFLPFLESKCLNKSFLIMMAGCTPHLRMVGVWFGLEKTLHCIMKLIMNC